MSTDVNEQVITGSTGAQNMDFAIATGRNETERRVKLRTASSICALSY